MVRKKTAEFYSEFDQIADREAFIETIREGFKEIEDPRAKDNQSLTLRRTSKNRLIKHGI